MAEFEEKLNSILGDQNAMSQIMALAQSLSGAGSPPAAEPHQRRAPTGQMRATGARKSASVQTNTKRWQKRPPYPQTQCITTKKRSFTPHT